MDYGIETDFSDTGIPIAQSRFQEGEASGTYRGGIEEIYFPQGYKNR